MTDFLKIKRISIFTKLVVAFLIVLMPVYGLSIQMNSWGASVVRNEVSRSFQAQLHFYMESLSREMDRVVRLQGTFAVDYDLSRLSLGESDLPSFEITSATKRFQEKLDLIKQSGLYVKSASVYIYPLHRIISTEELSKGMTEAEETELKAYSQDSSMSPISLVDHKLVIRYVYPVYQVQAGRSPIFMLETELSEEKIRGFLSNITNQYVGSGAALITNDWSIHVNKNENVVDQINQIVMDQKKDKVSQIAGVQRNIIDNTAYLTVYEYSDALNLTLVISVPEQEILGILQKYKIYMLIISGISILVILFFSYWIFKVFHKPLIQLLRAFRTVESGNLSVTIKYRSKDEFNDLFERFNLMTSKLRTLVYEVYEQGLRAKQAELKQLQSQINPHFLYNSLYLVYRLIKAEDSSNALILTRFIGDYFQYITHKSGDEVFLEQEWEHVKKYTNIQIFRFSNRVNLEFADLPEEVCKLIVPRLILQPLVENAFHHGMEHTLTGGMIRVTAIVENTCLQIGIADNGPGLTEQELAEWQRKFKFSEDVDNVSGIVNVHRRLQLKFGNHSGLTMSGNGEERGLCVTMIIPLQNKLKE